MITREEILKGQKIPSELEENLRDLLQALNKFRAVYAKPMSVNSGYRSVEHNKKAGGAVRSAHLYCRAADFKDNDNSLSSFCLKNLTLLEECGLWLENPKATKGWVHLDTVSRKNRVFNP